MNPAMRWVVATSNPHKLVEIRAILEPLGVALMSPKELGVVLDVEEWGATFAENAAIKALAWHEHTGLPALADDSGLAVDALDGAPGVYSARYAGVGASDEENNTRLIEVMDAVPDTERAASYQCVIAVAGVPLSDGEEAAVLSDVVGIAPDGRSVVAGTPVLTASGTMPGEVARVSRGEGGFGYDPWIRLADGRHVAELGSVEKNGMSHRGEALRALVSLWSRRT